MFYISYSNLVLRINPTQLLQYCEVHNVCVHSVYTVCMLIAVILVQLMYTLLQTFK